MTMTLQEAERIAKAHTWWSEECPGAWQYYYALYSFADYRLYFHPDYLSIAFLTVKNGFVQEKTPSDERLKVYEWLKQRYQEDHRFIDSEHERWSAIRDECVDLGYRIVRECSTWDAQQLANEYRSLLVRAIDSVRWGTFIECVDDYNSFVLPQRIAEFFPQISREEQTQLMMTLSTPLIVSFMEEFQAEKAACCVEYRNVIADSLAWNDLPRDSACRKAVEGLANRYQWMSVNYAGSDSLTPEALFVELRSTVATQSDAECEQIIHTQESKIDRCAAEQAAVEARYHLPQDLIDDFSIMRSIGAWMDERKESMVKTSWALSVLLQRMADLTGVQKTHLEWYTKEEVVALLEDGTRVPHAVVQNRSTKAVFATQWNDATQEAALTIFTGSDADVLYDALQPAQQDVLSGLVASQGSRAQSEFCGTVSVILNVATESFTPGTILVTSMTRPEFLPLMKHAAAIITDEGGITCHAAIVSRELGIPCIIATQHATKMLQTGQRVCLNLHTGTITIND